MKMVKYQSLVAKIEKISDTEYKLTTEDNWTYKYICLPRTSESFLKEEALWRMRVIEGEDILLNTSEHSRAYICWNYEGRAMLEVPLKRVFSKDPESNNYGSEINSFDYEGEEDWSVDPNCPLPKKR